MKDLIGKVNLKKLHYVDQFIIGACMEVQKHACMHACTQALTET